MTLPLRRFMLTTHITFSVGWLGAVAVFFVLAITGLTSQDAEIVRASYLAMELSGWFIIVPASIGALLSGLVQSLGTQWGLFKHYWILVKLLLTVGATLLLFLHMQPVSFVADVAAKTMLSATELRGLRIQLIGDASAALFVLLAATFISVYKPWGRVEFSINREQRNLAFKTDNSTGRYIIIGLVCFVILIAIIHLAGGGMGHH